MDFKTCEQYVLSLLESAQADNEKLQENLETLSKDKENIIAAYNQLNAILMTLQEVFTVVVGEDGQLSITLKEDNLNPEKDPGASGRLNTLYTLFGPKPEPEEAKENK